MLKADLRKIYFKKNSHISPSERLENSARISQKFFSDFELSGIRILNLFLSIVSVREIETDFIYEKIWGDFPWIKIVVPRVKDNEIESHEFRPATNLALSSWQIPEPIGNELIEADQIDLVLVPLLCFDKRGFRVGYGKGFYDKFLKKCRADCLKIGVSYFPPIEEISDINDFDVTLDYCITPKKIWKI